MAIVGQNLSAAYPDVNKGVGTTMVPLDEEVTGRVRPYLLTLVGAVAFVLLMCVRERVEPVAGPRRVAAARVRRSRRTRRKPGAHRASARHRKRRPRARRRCVGAARGNVGDARRACGAAGRDSRASEVHLDPRVVVFTVVVSVLAGVLFGLAPAWRAARPDLHDTLKEGGRGIGVGRHRAQAAFVVAETALAVMLLVGAGLMVRTLARLWNVNPGFRAENVLTFGASCHRHEAAASMRFRAAERQLHDAIARAPGVAAASLSWGSFPMNGDDEEISGSTGSPSPRA